MLSEDYDMLRAAVERRGGIMVGGVPGIVRGTYGSRHGEAD